MGIFSTLQDFTSGYSPVESFLFDRLCRRATASLHDFALDHIGAAVSPGMRLLDVGCGGGRFALRIAERFPDVTIVGLDLSPEQIARAKRRSRALADRVSFVQGTALDLPFDPGAFDLVYSVGSLKHWPEPERGLRECVRVLAPRGKLWVMEGDRGCRHSDVRDFISSWDIPSMWHPVAAAFYRVVVVAQSLDLDDARALLAAIPAFEGSLERAPGLPAWVLEGTPVR